VLLENLPAGGRLLVVTNTSVPPLPRAYEILRASLGTRGRIACWLDVRDDPALGEALAALITEEEPATAKAGLSGPGSPAGSAQLPG